MECVRSSSLKYWPGANYEPTRWLDDTATHAVSASSPSMEIQTQAMDMEFMPHSAPSTCTLLSSACRRAASFPLANRAFLHGDLQVITILLTT